ncbi:MAG: 30S ribosomal protein S15 [Candidatus Woesearchaeota archaeon]|jgi:small subunit ribosomal protein S15|nr:30S ribosomal protein S15 [Candidatus Woesearchaeota archaeon]
MARMHSHKKGKSGSKKPMKMGTYSWMNYKPKEIELLIVKLAKEGNTGSKIGIIMRDVYGVPDVKSLTTKSITQILKEKDVLPKLPENLTALLKKIVALQKHKEKNKGDMTAKRGIMLTEAKIMRLIPYYKKHGMLAENWNYDPKNVSLLIE